MEPNDKQNWTLSSESAPTTLWPEGWIQVKVPLPFSLRWVNSYIIPESEGYTLIDPGLRTDEAIEVWDMVLKKHQLVWTDIKRVIVTHQHPDHYGLAGYVQQLSGSPVLMSKPSHHYVRRLWGEESEFSAELQVLYEVHGMPAELRTAIARNLDTFIARVSPQPRVHYIEAGTTLNIGGSSWEIIDVPGHATGQLAFYEPNRRWMICGDQVLPRITPNVSIVPGDIEDPLTAFLHSLEELKSYEVELAFPGHREPFTHFKERLTELQEHHVRRLDCMRELLANEPKSAYWLCEELFGRHLRDNAHHLRFAMSETIAHLVYLERHGVIAQHTEGGIIHYQSQV